MGFILNILNLPFSFSIENLKFNISNKYITSINNIPIKGILIEASEFPNL